MDNEIEDEKILLRALINKDVKAFSTFGKKYRDHLIIFTFCQLNDIYLATRIVDELFESLWADSKFHLIEPPIYNYLREEIRRLCQH